MSFIKYMTIVGILLFYTEARKMKLKEAVKFLSPQSWSPSKIPCINDNLIFPEEIEGEIRLEDSKIFVHEIVLPIEGTILLNSGMLQLTSQHKNIMGCPGQDLQYVHINKRSWMATDSWINIDGNKKGGLEAIPHYDQIPCLSDQVIIPKIDYALQLPFTPQTVRNIILEDKALSNYQWKDISLTKPDIFLNWDGAGVSTVRISYDTDTCYENGICYCHQDEMPTELCLNVKCPVNDCLEPVTPFYNCCPICGGVIQYRIDNENVGTFLKKLEDATSQLISDWNMKDISWYVGAVVDNGIKYLQLIVMEKSNYDKSSVKITQHIYEKFESEFHNAAMKVSGLPWVNSKSSIRGIEALVTLVTVLIFLILVLIVYYPPRCIGNSLSFGYGDFARFENRSREGSLILSISHLSLDKAFENPMYATKETQNKDVSFIHENQENDSDTNEEEVGSINEDKN